MKRFILLTTLLVLIGTLFCQDKEQEASKTEVWEPVPVKITPGENYVPPSDAIVIFDGKDLSNWTDSKGNEARWKVEEGAMVVVPKTGSIATKQKFGDCQLHIEFKIPVENKGEGQDKGNSGIFLQKRYEVQVLDSYENKTYANGQAGSIYKQHIPLVNACLEPDKWQMYDIIYRAPRFNEDTSLKSPGYMTVMHNNVLIHNHVELKGTTAWKGEPKYKLHEPKDSISLQDHGHPVRYRNIWVREL